MRTNNHFQMQKYFLLEYALSGEKYQILIFFEWTGKLRAPENRQKADNMQD